MTRDSNIERARKLDTTRHFTETLLLTRVDASDFDASPERPLFLKGFPCHHGRQHGMPKNGRANRIRLTGDAARTILAEFASIMRGHRVDEPANPRGRTHDIPEALQLHATVTGIFHSDHAVFDSPFAGPFGTLHCERANDAAITTLHTPHGDPLNRVRAILRHIVVDRRVPRDSRGIHIGFSLYKGAGNDGPSSQTWIEIGTPLPSDPHVGMTRWYAPSLTKACAFAEADMRARVRDTLGRDAPLDADHGRGHPGTTARHAVARLDDHVRHVLATSRDPDDAYMINAAMFLPSAGAAPRAHAELEASAHLAGPNHVVKCHAGTIDRACASLVATLPVGNTSNMPAHMA